LFAFGTLMTAEEMTIETCGFHQQLNIPVKYIYTDETGVI